MRYINDTTMSMSVPRRQGWRIVWVVLRVTISAYLHRQQSIVFTVGDGDLI